MFGNPPTPRRFCGSGFPQSKLFTRGLLLLPTGWVFSRPVPVPTGFVVVMALAEFFPLLHDKLHVFHM